MALINTLRNKMGKVVVAFIAAAIFAFILADLLGSGSGLFNDNNQVGEIAGEEISLKEFQGMVQQRENFYAMRFNRQPSEGERPMLRDQAWRLLITKYAFNDQYEKVGVEVTSDEVWDMMQGKNQDPSVRQFFTNPETGEFDRQLFLDFLKNSENQAPVYQNYWYMIKADLKPGRERLKYENILLKSNYVTSAEAGRSYHAENDIAEIEYLYVPFYTVSDTAVDVTESQLEAYYNEHKENYKADHTRSLQYVSFPIIPSETDTAFAKEEVQELQDAFKTTEMDSVFAGTNTSLASDNFFGKYTAETLPTQLKANVSNLSIGDVRGPYLTATGYVLYKISDIYEESAADTVEAATVYKVATIERNIIAEADTRNEAFRKADLFAAKSNDLESFNANVKEEGLNIIPSGELGQNERRITGLGEARDIIQWLFTDASMGEISEVYEQDDQYIVAVMTEETEEGYQSLSAVKNQITAKVKDELKGDQIINRLKDLSGSLDEIAAAYGNDASVYTSSDLKLSSNSLPNLKSAPEAVGLAFSLKSGERSEPFASENNGVLIIATQNITIAPEIADYSAYRNMLQQRLNSDTGSDINDAITKNAGIVDERYKFY
ncbi:MAG: SurA N-terminal domain-containing protein [Fulvivirga sp.]